MDEARAGAPAWILVATGIVHLLYAVIYAAWTLIPLGMATMIYVSAWLGGEPLENVIGGLMLTLPIPLIQLVCFCVAGLASLVVIWGGVRLNRYRSKGLVWLAIVGAPLIPVFCMLVNMGSAMNLVSLGMGCLTGCLLGNIPTLVTLLVGIVGAVAGIIGATSRQW